MIYDATITRSVTVYFDAIRSLYLPTITEDLAVQALIS